VPQVKSVTIISNPAAGQRSRPLLDATIKALQAKGREVELLFTNYAGHATTLARVCADEGKADLIVAAGGDGTVREVAEGLIGSGMPIGIIPAGTANVLARELGYLKAGVKSPSRVARILCGKTDKPVHPFVVTLPERTTTGLCWVGVGFDAEVLRHVNLKLKATFGRAAFMPAILKALFLEKAIPQVPWAYQFGLDSPAETGLCAWGLVSNIERYAGPFHLTRKTSLTDRGLACLLFEKSGGWARAVDQLLIAFKPLDKRAATRVITEGRLTLGSVTTPVQLDGDLVGYGPVTVEPIAEALLFKATE